MHLRLSGYQAERRADGDSEACRPGPALRSYVRVEGNRLDLVPYRLDEGLRILLNLEIPKSHYAPASLGQGRVLSFVAGDVSLDLLVPVAAPAPWLPLARVAMPERPVDEHGDLPAREGDVYATTGSGPMTPEPPETGPPQRGAEQPLGTRVRAADACHDPAPAFRRGGRGTKRV